MKFASLAVLALAAIACSKPAPTQAEPGAVSGSASAAASAAPAGSAAAAAGSPAAADRSQWAGAYVAKVGSVEPPKAANEKAWVDDPGSVATGKGTIELQIGEPPGEARGHLTGALGELDLAGSFDGHELYATLRPVQPNAGTALTGTAELVVQGTSMKGSARLSGADGKTVRQAELELTRR